MAKDCYYLRHKRNQELFAYLEINETLDDSFVMEFCITDSEPLFIHTGAQDKNRNELQMFEEIATTPIRIVLHDKQMEWKLIPKDIQLEYVVKTFTDSFKEPNNKDYESTQKDK